MWKESFKNKHINNFAIRVINLTIPFAAKRRELRNILKGFLLEALKDKLSAQYPNYFQFAMFQPWGDFYIPCVLFKEFKKQNNNVKILAVCVNDNQEEILRSFDSIDEVIKIPQEDYGSLFSITVSQNYVQTLKKGRLYCLSHWLFSEAEKNKSMNFFELYTKMLKLHYPSNVDISKLYNIKNAKYSNTVLLYPEANSFNSEELTKDFWLSLANQISAMGFDIIFNTKNKKYSNYKTIFLPMKEQIEMAKCCKYVIGVRSGFSDILALNEVKNHIVVYPKSMYFKTVTKEQQEKEFKRAFVMEQGKTFEENMYRLTSLKMFNDHAKEIFYCTVQQLNSEIIKYITEGKE